MVFGKQATAEKLPTLRTVFRALDKTMEESSNKQRSSQIIAKAAVMSVAAALEAHPYRKEIGVQHTHHRLLRTVLSKLVALTRNSKMLTSEIQRLLNYGPQKYYQVALGELGSLYPRGK